MDWFSFPHGACVMQTLHWPDATSLFRWVPVKLVLPYCCECHTHNSSFLAEPQECPQASLSCRVTVPCLWQDECRRGWYIRRPPWEPPFWRPLLEAILLQELEAEITFLSFSKCAVLALLFAKQGLRQWGKQDSQGLISVDQGCLWGPKDWNHLRLFKGLFTVCALASTVAQCTSRARRSSCVSWRSWRCIVLMRHKRLRGVRWS